MADLNNDILKRAQYVIKTFRDGLAQGCKLYSITMQKELTTVNEILEALKAAKSPADIKIFENEESFQYFLANKN